LKILILNGSGLQIQTNGTVSNIRWVGYLLHPVVGRHLEAGEHFHTLRGPGHAEAYMGGCGAVGTAFGLKVEADGIFHWVGLLQ